MISAIFGKESFAAASYIYFPGIVSLQTLFDCPVKAQMPLGTDLTCTVDSHIIFAMGNFPVIL
jgi:hypothetical protein